MGTIIRHVEDKRIKRASVVLNQVWEIAERKFKTDFKMRMFLFESLILAILLYGDTKRERERESRCRKTKSKVHQVDTGTGHQNTRIYCPGGNEENKSKGGSGK